MTARYDEVYMNRTTCLKFALGLALTGGCAEHTKPDPEFATVETVRPYQRMAQVQRSAGARADGNLYAVHFTDDAVNSLGRAKIDAMLGNDEVVRPLAIHMAPAADHDALMRRMESVTAYLKDQGLTDAQMHFVSGLSDASYHPSGPDLANLRKTDSGESPGATGAPTLPAADAVLK